MKILVIGGSYFFGRVFVMSAAKEHDLTVVNRGTFSMEEYGVKQIRGDRRNEALWRECREDYDVIVDFCAYEQGDIAKVLRHFPGKVRQYIFISTVDVYRRGISGFKKEDTPFETRQIPGEAGKYIAGKVALEGELWEECRARNMEGTVLRPAILYGPLNYAPRESVFIRLAAKEHILPRVMNATGRFQFLYVKDAAEAVMKCLLNERTYGEAYNLCQDLVLDYMLFFNCLKQAAGIELRQVPLTVEEAEENDFPLPFPVREEETELYSNEKSKRELGMVYTGFLAGMTKTYRAFAET